MQMCVSTCQATSFPKGHFVKQLCLLLALFALVAGCSKKPATDTATTTTPAAAPGTATTPPATPAAAESGVPGAPAAAKPVPAQLPDVMARVNGQSVLRSDFEDAIRNVEEQNGPVPADRRDEFYRALLDDLVGYHLLQQEATARKLVVADAEVDVRVKQVRDQVGDEAAFQKALAERKTTLERVRADMRRQMLVDRLIEVEVVPTISVRPEQVTDFYNQNPAQFVQPETLRTSHILVRLPEQADEAAKKEMRAKAEALLRQVKAGADFAKVAKESSQDPGSAQNGGELPPFSKGQMIPPFEEAAFALKPGQTSDVVETSFGFHIIRLHERRAPALVPLNQVQAQIQQYLADQQRQEKVAALIAALKAKGKVEILI